MHKEVVFIVDDEPMHAQMMEDHLRSKYPQFDIYKYSTGEECNDNMDKNPSIVILDYHLDAVNKSARNGLEVLEHIKRKYETVDVIMISGQDKMDVAIDCMRAGAYDYVVKNETSFLRTENAIERLFQHRSVVHNMNKYKRLSQIFAWTVAGIVILAFVLFITGVIS
ncbi:MAG: response regulator [Chitinophagales bacterium]